MTTDKANEERFDQLVRSIVHRLRVEEKAVASLAPRNQNLLLVAFLWGEVMNGGFHQWWHNPTGEQAIETMAILREIVADMAKVVAGAIAIITRNPNASIRPWNLDVEFPGLSEEEQDRKLDSLRDELLESEREFTRLWPSVVSKALAWWDRQGDSTSTAP